MPSATLNGAVIYYETHGSGRPIVFAHGVGGNHASWFNQVAEFSRSNLIVTFDHRGFGNSRDRPEPLGRSEFVRDLEELFNHLGLEKAVLVGQSMGGGTCVGFTYRNPERVAALLLADTVQGIAEEGTIKEEMDQVRRETENMSQADRVLGPTTRDEQHAATVLYRQLASFNSVNRETLAGTFAPGVAVAALGTLEVPIMFLVGEEDVLYPPRVVKAVSERVDGAMYVAIPRAGHSVYFERPEAFNATLRQFLRQIDWLG